MGGRGGQAGSCATQQLPFSREVATSCRAWRARGRGRLTGFVKAEPESGSCVSTTTHPNSSLDFIA
ncbi:MAG: hypothetical protein ACXQTZ_02775, partial [Candidatus Alkanophagales archaeon]